VNTSPTLGWNIRQGGGYECRMTWYGVVTVTAHGTTRQDASLRAAALYRAVMVLYVQKEARA